MPPVGLKDSNRKRLDAQEAAIRAMLERLKGTPPKWSQADVDAIIAIIMSGA